MESVSYRPARLQDLEGIMEVETEAFDPALRESADIFAERMSLFPQGFFVAVSGGMVLGYVCSELWDGIPPLAADNFGLGHSIARRHSLGGRILYVSSFGIRATTRGSGLGSRLWREFETYASEAIKPLAWALIVAETWKGARSIYEKSGFAVSGVLPSFFAPRNGAEAAALVMTREVPAAVFRDRIRAEFSGTSAEEPLLALDDIYSGADAAARAWERTSGLSCPDGCGRCCTRFMPDILPAEALYLASWIALEAPSLRKDLDAPIKTHCPFYLDNTPRHCAVYPARPLVCRMFGMSGIADKSGNPEFSLCFAMRQNSVKRVFGGTEIIREFNSLPPVISDYGMRLASLLPDRAHERRSLPEAAKDAYDRVKTMLSMKKA